MLHEISHLTKLDLLTLDVKSPALDIIFLLMHNVFAYSCLINAPSKSECSKYLQTFSLVIMAPYDVTPNLVWLLYTIFLGLHKEEAGGYFRQYSKTKFGYSKTLTFSNHCLCLFGLLHALIILINHVMLDNYVFYPYMDSLMFGLSSIQPHLTRGVKFI